MYAITESGYRAIASEMQLAPGETLAYEIPAALLVRARGNQMRGERRQLLRATDWTQMPDAPLSLVDRQAWAAYRQALRDLPQLPGFPDVEWPRPPVLADGTADAGDGVGDL